MTDNLSTLGQLADDILRIRAEIADLTARKRDLERAILESGLPVVEGRTARAVVVAEAVRWSLDTRAITEEMGEDWVAAHSRASVVGAHVRVGARRADAA